MKRFGLFSRDSRSTPWCCSDRGSPSGSDAVRASESSWRLLAPRPGASRRGFSAGSAGAGFGDFASLVPAFSRSVFRTAVRGCRLQGRLGCCCCLSSGRGSSAWRSVGSCGCLDRDVSWRLVRGGLLGAPFGDQVARAPGGASGRDAGSGQGCPIVPDGVFGCRLRRAGSGVESRGGCRGCLGVGRHRRVHVSQPARYLRSHRLGCQLADVSGSLVVNRFAALPVRPVPPGPRPSV